MGASVTRTLKKKEEEEGKEKMEDIEEQKWFEEVIGSQWRV